MLHQIKSVTVTYNTEELFLNVVQTSKKECVCFCLSAALQLRFGQPKRSNWKLCEAMFYETSYTFADHYLRLLCVNFGSPVLGSQIEKGMMCFSLFFCTRLLRGKKKTVGGGCEPYACEQCVDARNNRKKVAPQPHQCEENSSQETQENANTFKTLRTAGCYMSTFFFYIG